MNERPAAMKNRCVAWEKKIETNVKRLCVCGGLVALTVGIAQKLNRITAVDFSTSAAITQNPCYAQCFLSNE